MINNSRYNSSPIYNSKYTYFIYIYIYIYICVCVCGGVLYAE